MKNMVRTIAFSILYFSFPSEHTHVPRRVLKEEHGRKKTEDFLSNQHRKLKQELKASSQDATAVSMLE